MKSRMVHWVSQGNSWGLGKPAASLPPPGANTPGEWPAEKHVFYVCFCSKIYMGSEWVSTMNGICRDDTAVDLKVVSSVL